MREVGRWIALIRDELRKVAEREVLADRSTGVAAIYIGMYWRSSAILHRRRPTFYIARTKYSRVLTPREITTKIEAVKLS